MTQVRMKDGQLIDIFAPRPEQFNIETIAWHLANQCRFNGATSRFYSVAEHSVIGTWTNKLTKAQRRAFLLHDAHEAVIGDITSPVAQAIGRPYINQMKRLLDTAISERFDVDLSDPMVHEMDKAMLIAEGKALMPAGFDPGVTSRFDMGDAVTTGDPTVDWSEYFIETWGGLKE